MRRFLFALGALGCTFVWLGFEMRAFTRLRALPLRC